MAEIKALGNAVHSALCEGNPLLALEQDFEKFALWLVSIPFEDRRGVYQDIGLEVIAREIKKRRGGNV